MCISDSPWAHASLLLDGISIGSATFARLTGAHNTQIWLDAKNKPVGSPAAYPARRLLIYCLPASIESGNLFACAQQRAAVALTDLLIEYFY